MPPPKLFPMFLKLAGQPCLVVGAGAIAESKIASLLEAEAQLTVVAPEATAQVRLWASSNRLEWHARVFEEEDLHGMLLVVAATSSTEVHQRIFDQAKRHRVFCNIADVPSLCDFYYPAVVERGALQIAISTSGQSPALAQRLRKELEEQFGPEYEAWLEELGKQRDELRAGKIDPDERKRILHELASAEAFAEFRQRCNKPQP